MTTAVESMKRDLELDVDGYLQNLDSWDVSVAEQLAAREGIGELTGEHWKLVAAIRLHYERTGMSPLCRDIIREAGFTKDDTYRLFPTFGYRSAYKLAGLPKPPHC
ncbi:MAG TPA: TusE/DsrC/DsvC family sulfur relay protein [Nitrospirota bacterium]|nr:TusE/DsrC/DsvC family sulfur relay protein [Nitrospirota bacterium]